MKLILNNFNKTALYLAVERENINIVRLLLSKKEIDVNIINILTFFVFNPIYNL